MSETLWVVVRFRLILVENYASANNRSCQASCKWKS